MTEIVRPGDVKPPKDFTATILGEVVLLRGIIDQLVDKGFVGRELVGLTANDVIRDSSRLGLRREHQRLGRDWGLRTEELTTGWVNAVVSIQAHTHEDKAGRIKENG